MYIKLSLPALALVMAPALSACGGSAETTPAEPAKEATSVAQAWCDWMARCDPHTLRGIGGAATCATRMELGLNAKMFLPGMNLDASWSAGCAKAINAAGCEDFEASFESGCVFSPGSLSTGSDCLHSGQCQSLACEGITEVDCGTCVESAALGEACAQKRCALGLACDSTTGVCVKAEPEKQPKPGDPCSKDCEPLLCINGVCSELLAIGEACHSDSSCAGDAWCSSGTCAPIKVLKQGDACGAEGTECDGSFCKIVSATERVCTPFLADGAACDPLQDQDGCLYPARCELGVCKLPGPAFCK